MHSNSHVTHATPMGFSEMCGENTQKTQGAVLTSELGALSVEIWGCLELKYGLGIKRSEDMVSPLWIPKLIGIKIRVMTKNPVASCVRLSVQHVICSISFRPFSNQMK